MGAEITIVRRKNWLWLMTEDKLASVPFVPILRTVCITNLPWPST